MSLALLPFYPLMSAVLLLLFGKRMSWATSAIFSVSTVFVSAISSAFLIQQLTVNDQIPIQVVLWSWFSLFGNGEMIVNFAFHFDALSAVMCAVVSGVGFLIHLYAVAYMRADDNFHRFMAFMNLFIVAMLVLVLADNLILLYLGWEAVGVCSFLLIGFWYQSKENVIAARKAFIVTRIGDTSMAIGLLWLFNTFGTVDIGSVNELAAQAWQMDENTVFWIALLLLGGAVGKSAQLPLQTWLPDAMAGPTPVSALIHAATMVTAGVYLIARMHDIFILVPSVMTVVAVIGATTLILAGVAALFQYDIKRVLAYSTMSQIGYMMLAMGAGAWSAGIFHLMTHAFFKALLFLTAGSIIVALHHEQNVFRMGGVFKRLPVESVLFIIGLMCLVALPGTSGFFSKEAIIAELWSSHTAGPIFWWAAIIGALLTSIYSCRLLFLVCFGKSRTITEIKPMNAVSIRVSLILLAVLSLTGSWLFIDLSPWFGIAKVNREDPSWLHLVALATPFVGLVFSWFCFAGIRRGEKRSLEQAEQRISKWRVYAFFHRGLGFDTLYRVLLVNPYIWVSQMNRKDFIDAIVMIFAWYAQLFKDVWQTSQNGYLRWYACAFAIGFVLLTAGWLI